MGRGALGRGARAAADSIAPLQPANRKLSVHLPAYNEPPDMLIETLDALSRLDYPNFEVIVVDNNTRDEASWRPVQAHCQRPGERFRFFHVAPLAGFKAGALKHTAEDAEVNAFKAMCYAEYRGFFYIGMITRNERNAIINCRPDCSGRSLPRSRRLLYKAKAVPFGPEPRDMERTRLGQPPAARQLGQFILRIAAFERYHARCGPAQTLHTVEQIGERCIGARNHGVECSVGRQALHPHLQRRDVGQFQHSHRVRHEADLLGHRIDQREAPLRFEHGERQARESGAGTDIGDQLAAQVRLCRKAVEQMGTDHGFPCGDRRQAIAAVPDREFIEQSQQSCRLLLIQRHAHGCRIADEPLRLAAHSMRTTVRPVIRPLR